MQVYGDIQRTEDAGVVAAEVVTRLDRCRRMSAGLDRHEALVAAFIRASELVQGVLDADCELSGWDDYGEQRGLAESILQRLASAVVASWESGFARPPMLESYALLNRLAEVGAIHTKQAEGYAFYALYPEAFVAAARQSGLGADTTVIGIRSIGAGLAALVAAAMGASTACSVRPTGHPFDRRLSIGPELASRLIKGTGSFAVVDEGPGLSGSSFNCVADWLVSHGVAEQRIHFFPSHSGGLGNQASDAHRQRWSRAKKYVASFELTILDAGRSEHRLANWIARVAGPLRLPLLDLSGGAWRAHRTDLARRGSMPVDPAIEKRKFLAVTERGIWLGKFAGIGSIGEAKLALAGELSRAGFTPAPRGLCHGFLVMPWLQARRGSALAPPIQHVLDYLAFRASLPALNPGATMDQLFAMAAYNFGEYWGERAAGSIRAALGDPARFDPVPCCTDNRMHIWEWLHCAQGWQKFDGIDHHAAHDMIGPQDIAWDVAGAAVEFGLCETERDNFAGALAARIRRPVERELVVASEICYLGFQIGLWTMALARNGVAEHEAIKLLIARYGERARKILETESNR
jgi:hypothetical protein